MKAPRKKYDKPQLIEYGDATQLIKGSDSSGISDDGTGGSSYYAPSLPSPNPNPNPNPFPFPNPNPNP